MRNPFDDPDAAFRVLANEQEQQSLWPAFADVPAGWTVVHGPTDRQSCVEFVTAHWTDLRPAALRTTTVSPR